MGDNYTYRSPIEMENNMTFRLAKNASDWRKVTDVYVPKDGLELKQFYVRADEERDCALFFCKSCGGAFIEEMYYVPRVKDCHGNLHYERYCPYCGESVISREEKIVGFTGINIRHKQTENLHSYRWAQFIEKEVYHHFESDMGTLDNMIRYIREPGDAEWWISQKEYYKSRINQIIRYWSITINPIFDMDYISIILSRKKNYNYPAICKFIEENEFPLKVNEELMNKRSDR